MGSILVVDDSEFFLTLVKSLLDRSGCTVHTAANARDAFEIIEKKGAQLILLDQCMPDMTGDEICRKIKGNPATQGIPVIILAVSTLKSEVDKCLAAGADDCISKPINRKDFLGTISKYLPIVKRSYERVPICEGVKYYHDGIEYSGHLHVISIGGAFIMGERMIPAGAIVRLKFSIARISELIEVKGKVAWTLDSKEKFPQLLATAQGMGIQFLEVSEAAKSAIVRYMALGDYVL